MGAKPWYDWVFRWRRAWDSNPRTVFGRQTISSRSRYDLFDSPPYISTVFRALRKCKKNTQEQYEILKFDPAKTLINQGFSAEKTARANAHFKSAPLWPLRYLSVYAQPAAFRCFFFKIRSKNWRKEQQNIYFSISQSLKSLYQSGIFSGQSSQLP